MNLRQIRGRAAAEGVEMVDQPKPSFIQDNISIVFENLFLRHLHIFLNLTCVQKLNNIQLQAGLKTFP